MQRHVAVPPKHIPKRIPLSNKLHSENVFKMFPEYCNFSPSISRNLLKILPTHSEKVPKIIRMFLNHLEVILKCSENVPKTL